MINLPDRLKRYSKKAITDALDADFADAVWEAADVQPVKHGFWYTEVYENVDLEYTIHVCSECEWESETKYNYCPRCGATMDGET